MGHHPRPPAARIGWGFCLCMRPPAGTAAPCWGVHSGRGWHRPRQTARQAVGVVSLTSKSTRRRPRVIAGPCAVSGQGCRPSCSQGGGKICRWSAAALRGGGLYPGRSGRGAPPAYPAGGRPMAPAPAAGWMVRPEIKGLTIPPTPHQPRGCGCTIKRTFPLSQRQEGPRPQPPSWVAQGPSKRRCGRPVRPSPRDWARALTARSARDYAFQRIACTSIEVQTLQPQGIAGTEKPARGIDVPGKKVYN